MPETLTLCPSAAFGQSFLVVFDFDCTIIDCNSDEVVPEHLGCGPLFESLVKKGGMQWTRLMDSVLAPYSKANIKDAVEKGVTMDEDMPSVFHFLSQSHLNGDEQGASPFPPVEIAVASDANVLFIEETISRHLPFARNSIKQIHSNAYHEVSAEGSRRSRVEWHEPNGHDCPCCMHREHPNMCKSRIIARLLHSTRLVDPTVVFVGDGSNDYCPVLNMLRPRDFMLARRCFPIHKELANRKSVGGCCGIALWSNAKDLLQCFQHILKPSGRLPPLARFRDVGPREFRSVTLLERMPNVLSRTLESNLAWVSAEGKRLLEALREATRANAPVSPLPGQLNVPPWLQAYSNAPEFDSRKGCDNCEAPRWGQLPWLHGEIYFYHLIAQYTLLQGSRTEVSEDGVAVPNIVSPYAVCTAVGNCTFSQTPEAAVVAKGSIPQQSFNPSFLAESTRGNGQPSVDDGILLLDSTRKFSDIAGGVSHVPGSGFFQSYRDFFADEKREVLRKFLRPKIFPMLSCAPWEMGDEFVEVMLRWMLWGNGVDLSMFTLEQLETISARAGGEKHECTADSCSLDELRNVERGIASQKDEHIVGNQLQEVAKLVHQTVRKTEAQLGKQCTINIVMDNVGVECVADLVFALWILHHHPSLVVVLHVKNMPYYVSDVTPADLVLLLEELEGYALREPGTAETLMSFVKLVRAALKDGRLRVDADTVWTQPCEYRELPPHVCNSYFFTQRVMDVEELKVSSRSNVDPFSCREFTPHSALVIFKGDLNFRRLVGDRHWDSRSFASTLAPVADNKARAEAPSFGEVVAGFWPAHVVPVCAIRTIKSECCVGVSSARQAELDRSDPQWRTSGSYGVILLAMDKR
ncbi:putative Phosphatase Protein of unknown function DUF89 [Trypanosoma vivax]|uniref:Damage-control phosphatase ARMT1-like metal-binding domain-containing protein n=1 Tax=Trypanosoma vivax (strain Y486) TaxID=1055687 RepID=G0TYZ8_TRYVY|nr:hypothetical protein TRVL_00138 [Trypanosoma vivax]KAH8613027.1 putative Phosphatase Protein of unknown function DUF89 [Trypanosoma vivax]CCC49201.1 conserved hypothetical protein [Trypanosoma vivax Y486]